MKPIHLCWLLVALPLTNHTTAASANENSDVATKADGGKKHKLRYKFTPGERLRTKVVHQAAVRTTIDGTTQTAETVSISLKVWRIRGVADGKISFVHSVEYVDMKNNVTGREAVEYDSREGKDPPPGFEDVAKRVGIPLTEVVMDDRGTISSREEPAPGTTPQNQITMPLPAEPVAVGETWTFPYDIRVTLQGGARRKVQARQRFDLLAVKEGIAEISVSTQILSPIDSKELESQLIQHETEGTIRFDIAAGRVVGQQIDLDRRVVGYPNRKSSMHYRTRFTEKLLEATAAKPSPTTTK